jgi:hypothetical protein
MRYGRGWIALLVLALLAPLGIIAAGGAWGEWSPGEIKDRVGYAPRGMHESTVHRREPPFEEYEVPGLKRSRAQRSLGYVAAAIAGAGLTAGAVFALGKGAAHGRIR